MSPVRILVLIVFAALGATGTYLLSQELREDARANWEAAASHSAAWLTGTLLGWLEESYAPISGLAALSENSDQVTETEFLNAYDGLEARATAFFLEAAALAHPVPGSDGKKWRIDIATDPDKFVVSDTNPALKSEIILVMRLAVARFGEIVLGRPMKGEDGRSTIAPVALASTDRQGDAVIVGLVDLSALAKGLFDLHVPPGMALTVVGRFPGLRAQGPERTVLDGLIDGQLHAVTTRTVSAGAELAITWQVNAKFQDGPNQELAEFALYASLAGIAVITLYLLGLLRHNDEITRRVNQATRDLSEKEALLRHALDNMPGAMYMLDKDLNLVLASKNLPEIFDTPPELIKPGQPAAAAMRHLIERGAYGADDVEVLLENRLNNIRSANPTGVELDLPDGRSLQTAFGVMEDGGRVGVITDITERKAQQRAIEESRQEIAEKSKVLEAVLESMSQGLLAFDSDLKLVAWNKKLREVRDYPTELTQFGTPFVDFMKFDIEHGEFGPGDPELQLMERIETARKFEIHDFERTRPNGRIVEVKGGPISGDAGFVSTFSDITERRRAETALVSAHGIVTESIEYAGRIQRSLLPRDINFAQNLADFFVIWEPRDVVGGDIYWFRDCNGGTLFAAVDCTGHGVPGAFMSIIATGALDRAMSEFPEGDPAVLISRIHQFVQNALGQDATLGESDDGLELGICRLSRDGGTLTYAGARFALWHGLPGEELAEIRGERTGIGYRRIDPDRRFARHEITVRPGERFYMASDGLMDQIGGERRRAWGKRRIKSTLTKTSHLPMDRQKQALMAAFADYQGDEPVRDDVTVLGLMPLAAETED